jgi:hypothetical protein
MQWLRRKTLVADFRTNPDLDSYLCNLPGRDGSENWKVSREKLSPSAEINRILSKFARYPF